MAKVMKAIRASERARAENFVRYCGACGLPQPEREFKYCEFRLWRADFAWPEHHLILEVNGGYWKGGGHSTGVGVRNDFDKYNYATLCGWRLLFVMPEQLVKAKTVKLVSHALGIELMDLSKVFE